MMRDVAKDSPAAKAGIPAYDILIAYGDRRLFSAERVSQLVKTDSPGKTVAIKLMRNGVTEDKNITLGEAQPMVAEEAPAGMPWMPMHRHHARPLEPLGRPSSQASADNWDTFDSLSLEKRHNGSYQAGIQYLDVNGKLVKPQFAGSREEIRGQLMKQPNLPVIERDQLLDALSAREDGGWPIMPFDPHMFPPSLSHGYPGS